MYPFDDDIKRIVTDRSYAKNLGLKVYQFRSSNLSALENKLKEIKSDDPNWKENVTNLKILIFVTYKNF